MYPVFFIQLKLEEDTIRYVIVKIIWYINKSTH